MRPTKRQAVMLITLVLAVAAAFDFAIDGGVTQFLFGEFLDILCDFGEIGDCE